MYYFVAAHSFSILCGRDPICQERSNDGFIKAKIKIIGSNLIVFGFCRSRLNRPLCQFLAENIRKQKSCKKINLKFRRLCVFWTGHNK